jgi:hypothetical protein
MEFVPLSPLETIEILQSEISSIDAQLIYRWKDVRMKGVKWDSPTRQMWVNDVIRLSDRRKLLVSQRNKLMKQQ